MGKLFDTTALSPWACAIVCMDGRAREPIVEEAKRRYGVLGVDTPTLAGPEDALAKIDGKVLDAMKFRVGVSMVGHKSKLLIVGGHSNCGGFSGDAAAHIEGLKKGMEIVRKWKYPDHEFKIVGMLAEAPANHPNGYVSAVLEFDPATEEIVQRKINEVGNLEPTKQ